MITVYLNGFDYENIEETSIHIIEKYSKKKIFEGIPKKNEFEIKISNMYINKIIEIRILDLRFKYKVINKKIDERGLYYTFIPEKDFTYNGKKVNKEKLVKINIHKNSLHNQKKVEDRIRNSRYKNKEIKLIISLSSLIFLILGIIFGIWISIILYIIEAIVIYFLKPFSHGDKKI
jgi:hypothetical protein